MLGIVCKHTLPSLNRNLMLALEMLIYALVNSAFSCFVSLEIPLVMKAFAYCCRQRKSADFGLHFFNSKYLLLKLKILLGVVIGGILHHLSDEIQLACWEQTRLNVVADEVAERAAEVLVARVT